MKKTSKIRKNRKPNLPTQSTTCGCESCNKQDGAAHGRPGAAYEHAK